MAVAADPDTAAAPGDDLATTGPADLLRIGLIGLGMLGAGFLLVMLVRRRRDHMGTPAPA